MVRCKVCVQFPGKFCSFISFGRELKKCCLSATCEAKWQVREVSGHYVGTTLITWLGKQNVHMRLVTVEAGGERGGGHNPREGYNYYIFSHAHRDWGTLQHRGLFKRGLLSRKYGNPSFLLLHKKAYTRDILTYRIFRFQWMSSIQQTF